MNKLFTKIAALALGATMAVGVGVAVASSGKEAATVYATTGYDTVYTLDCTSSSVQTTNSTYGNTGTVTVSNVGWTFTGNGKINPWRIGGKTAQSGNQPFWTTTAYPTSPSTIDRIEVTFGSVSGLTFSSFSASIHNSAADAESGSNAVATFSDLTHTADTTVGIDLGASYSGKFYRFVPNVTISATKNKYLQLSKVEFLKKQSIPATSISLSSANFTPVAGVITIEKDSGNDEDTLTATVTPNDATDKTVTWSSDNESVAQVEDGLVVIDTSAVGEATITASANGGTNVTATMTYSVVDSSATEYNVSVTATNGSYLPASPTIYENGNTTIAFSANDGYKLPTSSSAFTVTNATLTSWNSTNGQLVISNPTAAPSVSVSMIQLNSYVITVSATNCTYTGVTSGTTTIREDQTATITFTANSGYQLPATVTPTNATADSWNETTGVLVISNPTGAVSISVTASVLSYDNTTNLTPGNYYIKYGSNYLSNVTSGHGDTTTTKADALVFVFSLVGDDSWEIKNGDNYLGIGSSSTSLTLDSTQTQLSISWETEASGTRIIKGSSGRDLAWYASSSQIRTYSGKTDGTNGMTLESAKTVSGFSVYSTGANKNVLKDSTFDATAAAAAGFQARLNYTDSTYDDVTSAATWTLDTSTTGTKTLTVSYLTYTDTSVTDMNVYVATIKTLSVNASDAKTSYVEGEQLNTAGLVITGYEQDSTAHVLAISDCSFSPVNGATLATSDTTVTVTYTNEDSTTASTTYSITVAAFVGYNKVTSTSDLVVGESYVVGVENNTHGKRLMSDVTGSGSSTYRTWVDATDAFNSEKTTVTQSGAATAGAVVVTLLSDGNGKYAFYDISNDKYISGSSSNYLVDHSTLSDAGDNAWWTIEFADNLMSVTLNGSTRVLGYNLGSPRFSTYASYAASSTTATNGTAHPVLFKMAGSSVKTAVTSFANTSLKMNDPAYEGDITTPNCASNYSAMKTAYEALSDAQKNVFQYSDDYAAARARMINWAKANGETFTYGAATPFAAATISILPIIGQNNDAVAIIVIISVVSLTAIGGYFFLRKRKENI